MTTRAAASESAVLERLRGWVLQVNPSAAELDPDADLIASGVLTSLQMVNFLLFIEDLRGAEIPEGLIKPENFQTLRIIREAFFGGGEARG